MGNIRKHNWSRVEPAGPESQIEKLWLKKETEELQGSKQD